MMTGLPPDPAQAFERDTKLSPSKIRRAIMILAAGIIALTAGMKSAFAQEGWSEPVLVFEGEGQVSAPAIVADEYGQVHAFWAFTPDDFVNGASRLIYYTRLDQKNWQPVDILAPAGSLVGLTAAMAGGRLSLLWDGASYAWAGPSLGASAKEWASPVKLNAAYFNSGLAVAPDGALWTIYGASDTNAVFVQKIDPESGVWGNSQLVAPASNAKAVPDAARLAISRDGIIHAVWAEYQLPTGWPPLGVYYSRSADGGQTWSVPRPLGDGDYNQPNVIAGPGREVYLAWVGKAGTGGKFFQASADDGETWGAVEVVLPAGTGGGSEGAPNLAVDSSGTIHMLYSNQSCLWHASREKGIWGAPECVSRRVPNEVGDLEAPAATLGLGNQLHALFWTNGGRRLWYMSRQLAGPGRAPMPLPTSVPLPTPTPAATLLPSPTAPTQFEVGNPATASGEALPAQTSMLAITAGIVPVAILFLVVFLGRRRR